MKLLGWLIAAFARLPLGALYVLADILAFVMHRAVRYRLSVVRKNLAESFPDYSEAELRRIERDFYRNFGDYIVETIKLEHITDEEMRRHMEFENVGEVDALLRSGRSITCYFAHCGNWEWVPSITLWSTLGADPSVRFCQVYRPLKNRWFDALFLKLRSRFGSQSFPKRTVFRDLLLMKREGITSITGFMSDQKPSHGDPTCVVEFLSHPTAMITGTETVARKLGDAAMYMDMYKIARGKYKVVMRSITDDASALEPMQLTREYARLLETTIRRNPAIWLWSHKRWKNPVTL